MRRPGTAPYVLERRQWLPRPLDETFAFFENPWNLPLITPPWLALRILTPPPPAMARGLVLDYRIRVLGVPLAWRSLIAEYDPPRGFRDVQVRGPYRLWDHRHRFWAEGEGTVVHDLVEYRLPLGPAGVVFHGWLIGRRLDAIFDHRRRRLAELLGGPGHWRETA